MSAIWATFQRELRAYFYSPMAYLILAFFLLVNGLVFGIIVSYLSDPRFGSGRPSELFFGGTFYFWLILLFVAPVLTMRLLAEERRSGSLEMLMTAPISETQVVLGKYLAAVAFYAFLWLPTVVYSVILDTYSEIDWGTVASGYLGVLGLGACFLAIGTFASSLSKNQVVAALVTFVTLVGLFTSFLMTGLVTNPRAKEVFEYLSLPHQMDQFSKGIVDSRSLILYLSVTVFFLFLTSRVLATRKGS